jgi:hypothetical protein
MTFTAGFLLGILAGAVVTGMLVAFGTITIHTEEPAHDGKTKKQKAQHS